MPNLHVFNPGHEVAILNGSEYYTAPANVVKMQTDLGFLPAWYASDDDCVFIENKIPDEFLQYLKTNLGFSPQIFDRENINQCNNLSVSPWGISPQIIYYFQQLKNEKNAAISVPAWNDGLKELSSRRFAAKCLSELCAKIPDISGELIPSFYADIKDIEQLVDTNKDTRFLAKAPYSSSGRGLLWLPQSGLTRTEVQILHGILKKQDCVSIEKVLDRKIDFAMEFFIEDDHTVSFEGYSLFETNKKGLYLGNFIGSQNDITEKLVAFISPELLNKVQLFLCDFLKDTFGEVYKGCIGVDMMIYEDIEGYKLHPCLEINVRYNMGYLALKISDRFIHSGSSGHFYIEYYKTGNEALNTHGKYQKEQPVVFVDNKIKRGYLSLCPVSETSNYIAYLIIK